MPDFSPQHGRPPASWHDAFAALPLENAPDDGWSRVAARLQPHRRRRQWLTPLAIAAALMLAIALPWRLHTPDSSPATDAADAPVVAATTTQAETTSLAQLHAESARLESLLQFARDDRVSSATAAAMVGEMDARIAAIDTALMQPGLSPERQLWLWRNRVDALRSLTGFESTRRWLAANGERYDGALARVD
ncbi:hypothetical protein IP90_00568 [Luteimonas cucumeris]|uniref:Uncharacterized protein n=1 Tax=Luteimonas cucumeris TaxID=985012 RepID=A0A562LFB0_9GAMM|nr:hypothetical protein [Luteimonas cucumeris]TWI06302.1 hypothetical protein IP90_00568 [Luteimonas cucumeris]